MPLDIGCRLHASPSGCQLDNWEAGPVFDVGFFSTVREGLPDVFGSGVSTSDLAGMFGHFHGLLHAWQSDDGDGLRQTFDDEDTVAMEADHMRDLSQKLRSHALPTVLIGFGAAGCGHKLWALLHSARLECFTDQALGEWTESVLSVASDYGVERMLADTQYVEASEVTGWFEETSAEDIALIVSGPLNDPGPAEQQVQAQENQHGLEDPDAADQLVDVGGHANADPDDDMFAEPPAPVRLSFPQLLGIPGLHHIIDNATKGLGDVMQKYKDNIYLAQQICRLIRKRDTRPKLLERCFSRGAGPQLADDVRKFEGWINTGRWGTVAFSVPEILKIKVAMVTCWDEALFMSGFDAVGDQQARATRDLAEQVTSAVQDPSWWGWLAMLEVVCSLLREHTIWAESCPCHYELMRRHRHEVSPALRKQWEGCPMRGLRAAELSSGEFLEALGRLWHVTTVQVLRVLPGDLTPQDRRAIIQEFDRARTHLSMYFTLKLTHLQDMSHLILQISHCNEVTAQVALRKVLTSTHSHPLAQKLRGVLRQACQRWLDGEALTAPQQRPLLEVISSLRYVPTSERAIEGQRAKIHRHGQGRPNHTGHFQSYFVRSPEMARALDTGKLVLQDFAWYCQSARNHHKACVSVGLSGHPSLDPGRLHVRRHRDVRMSQVIYHADSFTLYSAETPNVHMKPGSGGATGPGPGQPHALPDGAADGSGQK